MSTFFERLREERQKLGLSQEEFGVLAGVKKRAQQNYEKGERFPDADYLMKIADHGVDTGYLVSGQEANPVPPSLPADEQLLIETYRALPLAKRREMLASLLTGDTVKASKIKGGKGGVIQGNGNIQVGGITK